MMVLGVETIIHINIMPIGVIEKCAYRGSCLDHKILLNQLVQ